MKKSYIIIGVVVIVMLVAIGIYAVINSNSQSKKQLEENSTNIEGTTNTENSTKENNTENKDEYIQNNQISNESEENNMYSTGKHHAEIVVKNYGTIVLELDADVAPITVENFANLVNEGFYNGLTFHRIISGFMIQGGDPLGNGTGGSSKTIKGEFASNGVKNSISHVRGTISMARSSMPNSASSQFFIVHQDSTFLDGQYAAFGTVTSGMEVVDKICADTAVEDDNGTVAKNNQPVIEKITIID
ncbi:peptidyl-prolyl cis-trans isomerase [Clostridium sp. CAG:245]|jgi:peptidyl-prolyl cis-trans isomerase|nr:peptidyl-prolyl cis-trans isomerase [Clostridium sp. CAG:245]